MIKILTATVAVVALTATARAGNTLPQSMTGTWCTDLDLSNGNHHAYYRQERRDCEDAGPTIRPNGYSIIWDECVFQKVTQDATGYWAVTKCEAVSEGPDRYPIGISWVNKEHYRINKDGYLVMDETELKKTCKVPCS